MYSYFQSENSSLMWVFYLNQKQGTISEIPECLKKKKLMHLQILLLLFVLLLPMDCPREKNAH